MYNVQQRGHRMYVSSVCCQKIHALAGEESTERIDLCLPPAAAAAAAAAADRGVVAPPAATRGHPRVVMDLAAAADNDDDEQRPAAVTIPWDPLAPDERQQQNDKAWRHGVRAPGFVTEPLLLQSMLLARV